MFKHRAKICKINALIKQVFVYLLPTLVAAVPPAKNRCAHNMSGESTLSSNTPLAPQAHRVV